MKNIKASFFLCGLCASVRDIWNVVIDKIQVLKNITHRLRCRLNIFLLFFLLIFFPCLLNSQEPQNEDLETWQIMEGEGLTIVGDPPEEKENTSPALPQRSEFGARKNVITEDQINQQGSLDFSDALRNVPGVIAGRRNIAGTTPGASLFVRGRGYTHPSTDVTTAFDGVPRYGLIYGQSMGDGIPLNAAKQIEVYKSPQPSEFGAGYALINIEPRYMEEDGWLAEGGFSGGSYYSFLQNAAFGFKQKNFDIFAAQSWMSSEGHVVHSAAHQQSYYLNAGFNISPNWELRALGNYVEAQTKQAPYAGQSWEDILSTYKTNSIFSTATLNNEYDNIKGFLKLYYNNTQFKWLDDDLRIPGDWSFQYLQGFGAKAKEEITFMEKGTAVAGMDMDWMLMINEEHNTTTPTIITTFPSMILFSPFTGVSWMFGDKEQWHITPSAGVRGFFHNVWANQASWQGALAVGWKDIGLNFNYSRGLVFPAPAVLQTMLGDPAVYNTADLKNVKPETIDHFESGITFTPEFEKNFSIALDGSYFYINGKDRIIITSLIPGNASSVSAFSLHGLEFAASLNVSPQKLYADNIEMFLGTTWYIDLTSTDENGNTTKTMPFTPVLSMSAGLRWDFLKRFYLAADFQFLYDLYSGSLGLSSSLFAPGESSKLNDIYLLNLRLGFNFEHKKWRLENSEMFVAVNNVFDHQYEYYSGYIMPGITYMLGANFRFR